MHRIEKERVLFLFSWNNIVNHTNHTKKMEVKYLEQYCIHFNTGGKGQYLCMVCACTFKNKPWYIIIAYFYVNNLPYNYHDEQFFHFRQKQ